MKESRKIEILRQLQYEIGRKGQSMPRDVGLTETEFQEMAADKLFELERLEEGPDNMDNLGIVGLRYEAQVLLAKYPDPLSPIPRTEPFALPTSPSGVFFQDVRKRSWDLFWKLMASLIIWLAGYYFGLKHGQSTPTSQIVKPAINSKP